MRTITLLFSALVLGTTAPAQTIATFESLPLTGSDTFYVNYSASGTDVGFNNGLAHFPCVYDTSFGGFLDHGFVYSNKTDSVTSGYTNGYSAKAGTGDAGSPKYAVAYGADNRIILTGAAKGKPLYGFYATNNTYAYNSMRDGDAFARKFHSGDWFLLTIKRYSGGVLKSDSVNFYLADFRFADTTHNYIVRNWTYVDLSSMGNVDSLQFHLSSSDNGSFGMNTPAYFCMDNFKTNETFVLGISSVTSETAARVYPNPARDVLYVDVTDRTVQQVTVMDMSGKVVSENVVSQSHVAINTSSLPSGVYMLQMTGNGKTATARFRKQ